MKQGLLVVGAAVAIVAWVAFGPLLDALPAGQEMTDALRELEAKVQSKQGDAARREMERLRAAWTRMRPWIELTTETETIRNFDQGLQRLDAALAMEGFAEARLEVAQLLSMWGSMSEP